MAHLLLPVALLLLPQSGHSFSCVAPAIPEAVRRSMDNARMLEGSGAPTDVQMNAAANVQRVKRVLPSSDFETLFSRANLGKGPKEGNGPYTYANFLRAVGKWPALCNDAGPEPTGIDLDNLCKKELATLFAMWAQEVGEHDLNSALPPWKQALYHFEEMGCANGCPGYRGATCRSDTWQGQRWPCPDGAEYFGRGAHQLSYNFNYGPFSEAVFNGDASVLLANPSLVVAADSNGWLAFASAIWFYMAPQSPKPSGHDAVVGWWVPNAVDLQEGRKPGFGVQIMIINGGVECGGPEPMAQAANRVSYYQSFCEFFHIAPGDNLHCTNMQQFGETSSAAVKTYWEQSWAWPQTCSCQLVSYQTSWSVFDNLANVNDPYCKCVSKFFGPDLDANPTCNSNASPAPTSSSLASKSPSVTPAPKPTPAPATTPLPLPSTTASRHPSPSQSPQPSGSPSQSPQPSVATSPLPQNVPSGACGPTWGVTCGAGLCCSGSGFCGVGTPWCGAGCQPAYGTCSTAADLSVKGRHAIPQAVVGAASAVLPATLVAVLGTLLVAVNVLVSRFRPAAVDFAAMTSEDV